jgi:hypothetical protein
LSPKTWCVGTVGSTKQMVVKVVNAERCRNVEKEKKKKRTKRKRKEPH